MFQHKVGCEFKVQYLIQKNLACEPSPASLPDVKELLQESNTRSVCNSFSSGLAIFFFCCYHIVPKLLWVHFLLTVVIAKLFLKVSQKSQSEVGVIVVAISSLFPK